MEVRFGRFPSYFDVPIVVTPLNIEALNLEDDRPRVMNRAELVAQQVSGHSQENWAGEGRTRPIRSVFVCLTKSGGELTGTMAICRRGTVRTLADERGS